MNPALPSWSKRSLLLTGIALLAACGSKPAPEPEEDDEDGVPTTTRPGWELTESNTGLARVGLNCGGLERYTGGRKPEAGTVLTERRIETTLDLSNGNIVIERSCIRPTSVGRWLPVITPTDVNRCDDNGCRVTPSMVTVRDSEIDGSLISQEDIAYSCASRAWGRSSATTCTTRAAASASSARAPRSTRSRTATT